MKTLCVLFVAVLLITASLQKADARRLDKEDKRKQVAEPQLTSDIDRSINYIEAKDATSSSKTRSSSDSDGEEDDDNNQSYGKYGNSNGSTPASHHYFPNDQKPIKN